MTAMADSDVPSTGNRMLKDCRTVVIVGIVGLVTSVLSGLLHDQPKFDRAAATQMKLCMPPDAYVVRELEIDHGQWSFRATWRFRSEMSWHEFKGWVGKRVETTRFGTDVEDGRHIEFRVHRTGETLSLTFERVTDESFLLVAGQFVVSAD